MGSPPTPTGRLGPPGSRRHGRGWVVAGAVLVIAAGGPAKAEGPALTSLLTPLNLVGYRPGTLPPSFSGQTLDAQPLSTSALRGKVSVLNFWASWCQECRPEMPMLERIHRELASRGLLIIGINARESKDAVRRYGRDLGLTFPLVLDPEGKINLLYGVVGLPATFVVGRDGRAVAFAVGPREWNGAAARALWERLLAEPAPPPP
jgi:cytochrome c biogenesis protein CcmG, thiol:disulfide interchange protein DsbE